MGSYGVILWSHMGGNTVELYGVMLWGDTMDSYGIILWGKMGSYLSYGMIEGQIGIGGALGKHGVIWAC